MKYYLDANVFLYATLDKGKLGITAANLITAVEKGKAKAAISALVVDEVIWVLLKERDRATAVRMGKAIFELANLEVIPLTEEIMFNSLSLMEKTNLSPRDSAHVATMKSKNISRIISQDKHFDSIENIERIDLKSLK